MNSTKVIGCYSSEALLVPFRLCRNGIRIRGFFIFRGEVAGIKIIRKINTNAALAIDSAGNEIVVLGKGIGFPAVPYELTDISKIDRTFYDINPRYIPMLASLPDSVVLASAAITEKAEIELGCELNPNLPLTLADHLNFAISRLQKGMELPAPLAYDIRQLYPRETQLGWEALRILERDTGVRLPDSEAFGVAMHIVNGEAESGSMTSMLMTLQVISEVDAIIEEFYDTRMDKESFHYSRFATHMQYLIQRLATDHQIQERGSETALNDIARQYAKAYACACCVSQHLRKQYGWTCNSEEVLYLTLHINRVQIREE